MLEFVVICSLVLLFKLIISNKFGLSGNYEVETIDMLTEAFLKATPLPKGHGRLIDTEASKTLIAVIC